MSDTLSAIQIDGERWITADSVRLFLGIHLSTDVWARRVVAKFKLRSKIGWLRNPQLLFSPEAADKIITNTPRLDEYGLPILPPEMPKRGARTLINPFKL